MNNSLQLVECPRDAMQGWPHMISTAAKVNYINSLLKVGFHTIDFGSFVSPKAIPQMSDTKEVLSALELNNTKSALLAIVANKRGADDAVSFGPVRYIGYPFSVSETFQQRNTNSTISESLNTIEAIQRSCTQNGKELVIYLSMGFGNPYGDPWNESIVFNWAAKLAGMGIKIISLADTVGLATSDQVSAMTGYLIKELPAVCIGVHLHATSNNWRDKIDAAYQAGCRRFDGAIKGIGGCPMAGNELVGNIDTLNVIDYLEQSGVDTGIDKKALQLSTSLANDIFQ